MKLLRRTEVRAATMNGATTRALRVDDSVGDILDHPAFGGFARLLLPWDDRRYDTSMPLKSIGALLPCHSEVDPAVVVSSLNRLIDDASVGRAIFYDVYTNAQKKAEPSRKDTGLFFFRGKPGSPFAIIAPGGGFEYVASLHEGFPYAVEISKRGYNAFVLKYRAGQGGAAATEDLATAATFAFRNARSLGVTTAGYSLWGSSAGARMVAALGSHGTARFGGSTYPSHRPWSPCTPHIRISGQRNLPPSSRLVMPMESHLQPSWNNGLRRCGEQGPVWSITSTPALVMASDLASGRMPKDGSRTPFASGRNRSSASAFRRMRWPPSGGRSGRLGPCSLPSSLLLTISRRALYLVYEA